MALQVRPSSPPGSGRPRSRGPTARAAQVRSPEPPWMPKSSRFLPACRSHGPPRHDSVVCSGAAASTAARARRFTRRPPLLYNLRSMGTSGDPLPREGTRCGGSYGHASDAEGGGWNASDPPGVDKHFPNESNSWRVEAEDLLFLR
jgi:hypothetical protein